jgi:hypothetical protein
VTGTLSLASTAATLPRSTRNWRGSSFAPGFILQSVGERVVAVTVDGDGETVFAPADALQQFDLDFLRLCEAVRKANRLEGRIQAIDARTVCLGGLGKGSRRREFYVVRALQSRNAIDIALAVKGRAAGGAVAILTAPSSGSPLSHAKGNLFPMASMTNSYGKCAVATSRRRRCCAAGSSARVRDPSGARRRGANGDGRGN